MLRLTVLPQPDALLRLAPGVVQARLMEAMLGHMFPSARMDEFRAVWDRRFLFHTPGRELALLMCMNREGIHVRPHAGESPDVTISGDLMALTALCLGLEDSDSLFFSRRLLMTGDTSVGLLFKNILGRLDFDLRGELAERLGSRAAEVLWRMGGQGLSLIERLDHGLAEHGQRLGQRFGLVPVEKVRQLEAELAHMRAVQRRPRQRRTSPAAS